MLRNMIRMTLCLSLICCVLQISAQQPAASGIVPPVVKFGGTLTDVNGKPVTGTVGVTFSLYKESQGGAALWVETQNLTLDKTGHYTAMLGSTTSQGIPADVFASGEARWLGVQAQGQTEQPRTLLMSVPYALKALDAETVGGLPPSAFVKAAAPGGASSANLNTPGAAITGTGTANHITKWLSPTKLGNSNIFDGSAGKVGIGTTAPGATLDVNGTAVIRSNATVDGSLGAGPITATSSSSGGTGVYANAGSSGGSNGIIAIGATGLAGYTSVAGSIALYGNGGNSTGSNGVVGYGATGVAGNSTITGSYGTYGSGSTGVWGNSTGTGANVGVLGLGATGVSGSGDTWGVLGESSSPNGSGGGFGNSSTGDALFTYNQSGGYAAFFDGDVDVDGNLSKAGGSFKIDHPLDPANKYLYHSFVESPDMMNVYAINSRPSANSRRRSWPARWRTINSPSRRISPTWKSPGK
jgi:hypothetical protein